jgi:RHS repeat-associated protein
MSGTVTDTYRYDAYGTLLEQTGSTTNPYLYRGEPYDAELDAYYLRARSYQPGTGRFLTTDPVEGHLADPMTWHRYVYGKNKPGELYRSIRRNYLERSSRNSRHFGFGFRNGLECRKL